MLLRRSLCLTRTQAVRYAYHSAVFTRTYSTASSGFFLAPMRVGAKPRAQQPLGPLWHKQSQRRGAKRKSTLVVNDLPQGALERTALPPQDDTEPEYPPLLQQVRNNMLKFSHCVLVTRVGGFYEVGIYRLTLSNANEISFTSSTPMSWLHF
jgi:hypothetical protein